MNEKAQGIKERLAEVIGKGYAERLTNQAAEDIVKTVFEYIIEKTVEEKKFRVGRRMLKMRETQPRLARNPRTGETFQSDGGKRSIRIKLD